MLRNRKEDVRNKEEVKTATEIKTVTEIKAHVRKEVRSRHLIIHLHDL
jgi:hypothetical protein